MTLARSFAMFAALVGALTVAAQQPSQIQLKIEPTNRTLTMTAWETVTAEPEIAILHIGFGTQPSDAKTAYASGARVSNAIVAAIKQAGVAEGAIRSDRQRLESYGGKHSFRLVQSWTVKVTPERAAEILDIAANAGATNSGEIDWTVEDTKALERKALEQATARARADAEVLAKGMGVKLGAVLFVTNSVSEFRTENRNFAALASMGLGVSSALPDSRQPLTIEPHTVSRTASVYAVFAIE